MPLTLGWGEIALRLALTLLAGVSIGINRGEHGEPAGLRTTILVCLAASVAMIQANLLLATAGRPASSFIMLDLMRLPLGILSGIGFIGAGVIVQKRNIVRGVTTAATLWFVTVMGLCFGGGQIALGLTILIISLIVLWGLKWVEDTWMQDRHAVFTLETGENGPGEEEISKRLLQDGFTIKSFGVAYSDGAKRCELRCEVKWRGRGRDIRPPELLREFAARRGVLKVNWRP